jgi:hypothetical protein
VFVKMCVTHWGECLLHIGVGGVLLCGPLLGWLPKGRACTPLLTLLHAALCSPFLPTHVSLLHTAAAGARVAAARAVVHPHHRHHRPAHVRGSRDERDVPHEPGTVRHAGGRVQQGLATQVLLLLLLCVLLRELSRARVLCVCVCVCVRNDAARTQSPDAPRC